MLVDGPDSCSSLMDSGTCAGLEELREACVPADSAERDAQETR